MADNITLRIDDARLQFYFSELTRKGMHTRPLLNNLGAIIEDAIDENFEQQGRPTKWRPLKPSTLKQRLKKGYTGPILQRTGKLKRSFTKKVTSDYVTVGTNEDYAAIHNFGGDCGRNHSVHMKARPFITLMDSDLDDILKTVVDYVDI